MTLPLFTKLVPHFGDDASDLATTFFETAPTFLTTVPRDLQKFASSVLIATRNSSALKRTCHAAAMRSARSAIQRRWNGAPHRLDGLAAPMRRSLVFKPILNKLGFDQLELVVSGGAPLSAETMALWQM